MNDQRTGAQRLLHDLWARMGRMSERAEGVISTAIAVLVIAALGVLMWVGFQTLLNNANSKANQQIEQIGG